MNIKNMKYKFNKNVIYKDRGEMLMAYNQESSDMYEFNQVGGEIFKKLEKEIPMSQIFDELTKEYNVEEKDIYDDVKQIVDRLIELNVIKVGDDDNV